MKNKELKILLSAPRGFCAGVERAIEIVEKSIQKYGTPVYVRHEIVHNKYVVDDLKNKGAIFVEELEEIEDKTRPVIFSAHGVPKKIPEDAKNYNMTYVDATCPLVSKVHREAENLNKAGYHLILIGHQNHPEVIGTMGQLPKGSIDLVQNENEAKKYKAQKNKKISYVTQTTLSVDDSAGQVLGAKSIDATPNGTNWFKADLHKKARIRESLRARRTLKSTVNGFGSTYSPYPLSTKVWYITEITKRYAVTTDVLVIIAE